MHCPVLVPESYHHLPKQRHLMSVMRRHRMLESFRRRSRRRRRRFRRMLVLVSCRLRRQTMLVCENQGQMLHRHRQYETHRSRHRTLYVSRRRLTARLECDLLRHLRQQTRLACVHHLLYSC